MQQFTCAPGTRLVQTIARARHSSARVPWPGARTLAIRSGRAESPDWLTVGTNIEGVVFAMFRFVGGTSAVIARCAPVATAEQGTCLWCCLCLPYWFVVLNGADVSNSLLVHQFRGIPTYVYMERLYSLVSPSSDSHIYNTES
jgi:hypothetical protein